MGRSPSARILAQALGQFVCLAVYPVVRLKDAPKTEVYLSPTPGKRWGGVGEPGATFMVPEQQINGIGLYGRVGRSGGSLCAGLRVEESYPDLAV
jgi:hypothetical protein